MGTDEKDKDDVGEIGSNKRARITKRDESQFEEGGRELLEKEEQAANSAHADRAAGEKEDSKPQQNDDHPGLFSVLIGDGKIP